jgi:hypothetical protein
MPSLASGKLRYALNVAEH